jgi:hypothetical protein
MKRDIGIRQGAGGAGVPMVEPALISVSSSQYGQGRQGRQYRAKREKTDTGLYNQGGGGLVLPK